MKYETMNLNVIVLLIWIRPKKQPYLFEWHGTVRNAFDALWLQNVDEPEKNI